MPTRTFGIAPRLQEYEHIRVFPEGEREEIRQIFARKGFEGEELERAVDVITADVERWVDTMVQEEHGLPLASPEPKKAALATFVAFAGAGAVPLVPFLWNWLVGPTFDVPFLWSAVGAALTFFGVGSLKGRFVEQRWLSAGAETLMNGRRSRRDRLWHRPAAEESRRLTSAGVRT